MNAQEINQLLNSSKNNFMENVELYFVNNLQSSSEHVLNNPFSNDVSKKLLLTSIIQATLLITSILYIIYTTLQKEDRN